MEEKRKSSNGYLGIGHMITRIIISMIVLAIAAFFTPGFSIAGIGPLILAALIIGILDYIIEKFTGFDASPFGRGITGFIVSAVIIYLTGYFINGVAVNFLGAILAALAIGVINMIIPGKQVF